MEKHNFVTIADLSKEKIMYLLEMAQEFEKHPNRELLKGKVVATLFFEPSTRTQLSFQTAANRLGARVIGFSDAKTSSTTKGETLKDTILMVSNYADVIAMRHFIEGAAQYASEVAPVPIVNAGDGAHMHPSQCLLDLYSIYKTQGTLENLNIYLVGDLKYGRTVHSLITAMRHFNPTFHFIAPKELAMPEEYKLYCKENNKSQLVVAAIENGTVIDHIPAEKTYQVVNLLQLEKMETPVTIGYNLPSKKIGKKGIIKVANKYFTDEEINRLSVVAPNIGLSIIKDYEIVEKKTVKTPDTLKGIVKCNNPKCITNNEPMQTLFHTVDKVLGIVRCHYCDKEQQLGKVELCK